MAYDSLLVEFMAESPSFVSVPACEFEYLNETLYFFVFDIKLLLVHITKLKIHQIQIQYQRLHHNTLVPTTNYYQYFPLPPQKISTIFQRTMTLKIVIRCCEGNSGAYCEFKTRIY